MTIEMINKWVTSFRFNEIKKLKKCLIGFLIDFIFCSFYSLGFSINHVTFQEVTSVWGVSAVAILDSSANCVCVWSTKKLTMPAYCVAANCNNSQTTPGITIDPQWGESGLNLYNSNEVTFLLRRITPICVASSSVSAISQTPWNIAWRSRHMVTWFGRHGDAFGTTENAFYRAFITLRSQFHLHHRSQRALTEIVSKITPNLGLVL